MTEHTFNVPEVAGITRGLVYWYTLAKKLETALHQAYLDGGCREDEASEMVGAFFTAVARQQDRK